MLYEHLWGISNNERTLMRREYLNVPQQRKKDTQVDKLTIFKAHGTRMALQYLRSAEEFPDIDELDDGNIGIGNDELMASEKGDASNGDGYNDTEIGHYNDADDNVGAFPQQEDNIQDTTTNVLTLAGDTSLDLLREAETTKDVQSGSTYTLDTAQLRSIDTNAASDSISTVGSRLHILRQSRKRTRADFDIEKGGSHRCEDCDLEVDIPAELLVYWKILQVNGSVMMTAGEMQDFEFHKSGSNGQRGGGVQGALHMKILIHIVSNFGHFFLLPRQAFLSLLPKSAYYCSSTSDSRAGQITIKNVSLGGIYFIQAVKPIPYFNKELF
ncbi:hypothetical protein ARMGADRAFT_1031936 [Armillaria gallica]|uniref:Uncharacterized protein n=1 Tax=Armillaria gallica TaxID=47427 RepID=A0A2H3DUY4_ARMGA|nr:hypothetical protein ARMGADRAFT_1031936 [Armillaria gallica]